MRTIIASLFILMSLAAFGYRGYSKAVFKRNVTGYLARAADASSIDIAKQELDIALNYLEENQLTSGYTSVLYTTPSEDIGFWYDNLKASSLSLENAKGANHLEESNVLMKLRETIFHRGGEGKESVTYPDAIYLHPNNVAWGWGTFGAVLGLFAGMILIVPKSEWEKSYSASKKEA